MNLEQLERRIAELEDRERIRNVLDRFSETADAKDMEKQGMLFAEDAKVNQHFGNETNVLDGRGNIVKAFGDYLSGVELTYHFNGQQSIVFEDKDRATVRSYCTVVQIIGKEGKRRMLTGGAHYIDRFVRNNGKWIIQVRDQYPDYLDEKEI